jgi:hypothetical protein
LDHGTHESATLAHPCHLEQHAAKQQHACIVPSGDTLPGDAIHAIV